MNSNEIMKDNCFNIMGHPSYNIVVVNDIYCMYLIVFYKKGKLIICRQKF